MGLLKRLLFILTNIIFIVSCSTSLIIRDIKREAEGLLTFGQVEERRFYSDKMLKPELQLKWNATTNGSQPNSSVLILNEHVIVSDLSGRIYSFDRTTGKQEGFEKFIGAISTAPVVNKLRFYFVVNVKEENFAQFIVFDYLNGKILSENKIAGSVTNELIKVADGVIVLSDIGELIKYNYGGGREWSIKTKSITLSNPAANDENIIFGNIKGELIIVERATGNIIYQEKVSESIESGFTIEDYIVYFGDSSGKLIAFDFNQKKVIWAISTGTKILATPVFNEDTIIIGNLAGDLFGIDKSSGKKKWVLKTKGIINTTPLLTRSFLIQPDFNKKVYFINPSLGLIVKTYEFERRVKLSPVLYDEILFLGTDRGEIFAYQTVEAK
jgi:outer membrane protein assembly factor BamB